jgi:hypothetical protein
MAIWASALLVGLIVAAIGGYLIWQGLQNLKREDLTPRETVETIKEDAQWIRRRAT